MVTVPGASIRALAYPALVGSPRVGDRVLLNVTALEAGLGTGGYALVVAIPDRLPADAELSGHIVKSRYTPLQVMTGSADEQGSPYHELLESADSLDAMPVVVADLLDRLMRLAGVDVPVWLDPARARPADVPVQYGDPARIRALCGWGPQVPLDQTLADVLATITP